VKALIAKLGPAGVLPNVLRPPVGIGAQFEVYFRIHLNRIMDEEELVKILWLLSTFVAIMVQSAIGLWCHALPSMPII
jgi:hypothetical protein